MYNVHISVGLMAHTYSTVHHMHEEAHVFYMLFKSQIGLSLFLLCHAAWDAGLSYQSHFGMLQDWTSYVSTAHPTQS